ncbi:hypothetical protein LBMAG53_38520 [Planctomycetota bacterium]|nr:hypothetical protein LBMAG53_38520 [Planctomycetota bacterium]
MHQQGEVLAGKANAADVERLTSETTAFHAGFSAGIAELQEWLRNVQSGVQQQGEALAGKANAVDVERLSSETTAFHAGFSAGIAELQEWLRNVQSGVQQQGEALAGKANAADVERLSSETTAFQAGISAGIAELQEWLRNVQSGVRQQGEALAGKANSADVERLTSEMTAFHAGFSSGIAELQEWLRNLSAAIERQASHPPAELIEMEQRRLIEPWKAEISENLHGLRNQAETWSRTTAARIDELKRHQSDHQSVLREQERRYLRILSEIAAILPKEPAVAATVAKGEEGRLMDRLYARFEDRFRGDRADIRQRLEIYLPEVRNSGAGTLRAPVLDIGCGRGEWLELLTAEGLVGRGIDTSAAFAALAEKLGIEAEKADALAHLRAQPDGSLGAVTAFHLVEHLPFTVLLALIAECHRVLRPGGLLLLETPNPGNLLVGANWFWLDPTHLRPLPPGMLQFFVAQAGFSDAAVREVNPMRTQDREQLGLHELSPGLERVLCGPMDYAIIAHRE